MWSHRGRVRFRYRLCDHHGLRKGSRLRSEAWRILPERSAVHASLKAYAIRTICSHRAIPNPGSNRTWPTTRRPRAGSAQACCARRMRATCSAMACSSPMSACRACRTSPSCAARWPMRACARSSSPRVLPEGLHARGYRPAQHPRSRAGAGGASPQPLSGARRCARALCRTGDRRLHAADPRAGRGSGRPGLGRAGGIAGGRRLRRGHAPGQPARVRRMARQRLHHQHRARGQSRLARRPRRCGCAGSSG